MVSWMINEKNMLDTRRKVVIDNVRTFFYNEKGNLHSLGSNKPSYIDIYGNIEWHYNGRLYKRFTNYEPGMNIIEKFDENQNCHCLCGPAQIIVEPKQTKNTKLWVINGKRHRLNGPAYEWSSGETDWEINLSVSYNPIMDNA